MSKLQLHVNTPEGIHGKLIQRYPAGSIQVVEVGDTKPWLISIDESSPPVVTIAATEGFTAVLDGVDIRYKNKTETETDFTRTQALLHLLQITIAG